MTKELLAALGFQPISTAPTDGTEVIVYVAERNGLSAFVSRCSYHPDAGWCADELREVTYWKPDETAIIKKLQDQIIEFKRMRKTLRKRILEVQAVIKLWENNSID